MNYKYVHREIVGWFNGLVGVHNSYTDEDDD